MQWVRAGLRLYSRGYVLLSRYGLSYHNISLAALAMRQLYRPCRHTLIHKHNQVRPYFFHLDSVLIAIIHRRWVFYYFVRAALAFTTGTIIHNALRRRVSREDFQA